MARHLLIGDGTAYGTTNGLVDDGAISVQKMSSNGPTELALGDSFLDAPQIRIVAGGSDGKDIVSPWIYGKDVINYSGAAYSAAAAHTSLITPTDTSAAAAKEIEVKLIRKDGPAPEFFKFSVDIAVSSVVNDAGAAILAAYNALTNIPDWLNPTCTGGSPAVTFAGSKRGDVCQSGNTWDYAPVIFDVMVSVNPTTTQTYPATNGAIDGTPGVGDGFAVKAFEESLMGASHGYYNRVQLPNAPTAQAATGTNYDMYSIVSTKDGSSSSQINGVDNLIEINIALKEGDADSLVVENKLNAYFAGSFAAITL
jgi:hypothetical protein